MYGFGQGGNDKLIGGVGDTIEHLYGGSGDDKLWAHNPGQFDDSFGLNYLAGNDDNDIIYGSQGKDYLYGDFIRTGAAYDFVGGDDIIYTGVNTSSTGDSVRGGAGDDKIYGQGYGDD